MLAWAVLCDCEQQLVCSMYAVIKEASVYTSRLGLLPHKLTAIAGKPQGYVMDLDYSSKISPGCPIRKPSALPDEIFTSWKPSTLYH